MKFSIFSRLIGGSLAVFILVIAVSLYAVAQLQRLNAITNDILNIDNLILDYEKRLTDSLLAQMRYERKYLLIKDSLLYRQFLSAQSDFVSYLDKIVAAADTSRKKAFALRAAEHYGRYRDMFGAEVKFIHTGTRYPSEQYRQEKSRALDAALEELKKLRAHCQYDTYEKIRKLGEAGTNARKVMAAMAGTALILGVTVPFFITKSITRPIGVMIGRTREIAAGDLKSDLNIVSPPEIGELARAFNTMCNKLKVLDKVKSDFFSSMSHELRTPLASIKEGTNLLLEDMGDGATAKQKKLLGIIDEESGRMIELVNSLMDLSKMEAGMMAFNLVPADIVPLLNRAIAEAEILSSSKGIAFVREFGAGLPDAGLDAERMLQALRNLIGNAVKFTPNGGTITVSARVSGRDLEVSVSDTGPGIPAESLVSIFEKFQQVPLADSYKIKGTGLGLAIVKHIITAHGGKVWAESGPGQGSSFIFALPV